MKFETVESLEKRAWYAVLNIFLVLTKMKTDKFMLRRALGQPNCSVPVLVVFFIESHVIIKIHQWFLYVIMYSLKCKFGLVLFVNKPYETIDL